LDTQNTPGASVRRAATVIAYLCPSVTILAMLAWAGGWFNHSGWNVFTTAVDVEWFLIPAGLVIGLVAGLVGATLAFRSGKGRIAAVIAVLVNLLFALLLWSFAHSIPAIG
jgi:hypothetical protein